MNIIQNEFEEAKKYMIEIDNRINTIVRITPKNVAKIEAMIKNDSAYLRASDKFAKLEMSKKENVKYPGSSAYWIMQLKDILMNGEEKSWENYTYEKCVQETINAIDRENSTHLNADKVGREEIFNRIIKIDKNELVELLKNPIKNDYKLIKMISKKTSKERENFSFATKFCHYVCFYLFEGNQEQDNFSIYDGVLVNALPKYCEKYNIRFDKKEIRKSYKTYLDIIDEIREKANQEYGEKISRNGFDYLIWYFHKGRN